MQTLLHALYWCILTASVSFAADYQNAKAIEELMLMDNNELSAEARRACANAAVSRDLGMEERALIAANYIETVMRVARTKNNGQEPWWIKEYRWAAGGTDGSHCNAISMKHLEDEIAKKKAGQPPESSHAIDRP